MSEIRSYEKAVKALKKDVWQYLNFSKKLKDDSSLLVLALVEFENCRFVADEWDMLFFSTSERFKPYFAKVVHDFPHVENQVTVLINFIMGSEDTGLDKSILNADSSFKWARYR